MFESDKVFITCISCHPRVECDSPIECAAASQTDSYMMWYVHSMRYDAMSLATWFLTFWDNAVRVKISSVLDISILEDEAKMLSQHIMEQLFRCGIISQKKRYLSYTVVENLETHMLLPLAKLNCACKQTFLPTPHIILLDFPCLYICTVSQSRLLYIPGCWLHS